MKKLTFIISSILILFATLTARERQINIKTERFSGPPKFDFILEKNDKLCIVRDKKNHNQVEKIINLFQKNELTFDDWDNIPKLSIEYYDDYKTEFNEKCKLTLVTNLISDIDNDLLKKYKKSLYAEEQSFLINAHEKNRTVTVFAANANAIRLAILGILEGSTFKTNTRLFQDMRDFFDFPMVKMRVARFDLDDTMVNGEDTPENCPDEDKPCRVRKIADQIIRGRYSHVLAADAMAAIYTFKKASKDYKDLLDGTEPDTSTITYPPTSNEAINMRWFGERGVKIINEASYGDTPTNLGMVEEWSTNAFLRVQKWSDYITGVSIPKVPFLLLKKEEEKFYFPCDDNDCTKIPQYIENEGWYSNKYFVEEETGNIFSRNLFACINADYQSGNCYPLSRNYVVGDLVVRKHGLDPKTGLMPEEPDVNHLSFSPSTGANLYSSFRNGNEWSLDDTNLPSFSEAFKNLVSNRVYNVSLNYNLSLLPNSTVQSIDIHKIKIELSHWDEKNKIIKRTFTNLVPITAEQELNGTASLNFRFSDIENYRQSVCFYNSSQVCDGDISTWSQLIGDTRGSGIHIRVLGEEEFTSEVKTVFTNIKLVEVDGTLHNIVEKKIDNQIRPLARVTSDLNNRCRPRLKESSSLHSAKMEGTDIDNLFRHPRSTNPIYDNIIPRSQLGTEYLIPERRDRATGKFSYTSLPAENANDTSQGLERRQRFIEMFEDQELRTGYDLTDTEAFQTGRIIDLKASNYCRKLQNPICLDDFCYQPSPYFIDYSSDIAISSYHRPEASNIDVFDPDMWKLTTPAPTLPKQLHNWKQVAEEFDAIDTSWISMVGHTENTYSYIGPGNFWMPNMAWKRESNHDYLTRILCSLDSSVALAGATPSSNMSNVEFLNPAKVTENSSETPSCDLNFYTPFQRSKALIWSDMFIPHRINGQKEYTRASGVSWPRISNEKQWQESPFLVTANPGDQSQVPLQDRLIDITKAPCPSKDCMDTSRMTSSISPELTIMNWFYEADIEAIGQTSDYLTSKRLNHPGFKTLGATYRSKDNTRLWASYSANNSKMIGLIHTYWTSEMAKTLKNPNYTEENENRELSGYCFWNPGRKLLNWFSMDDCSMENPMFSSTNFQCKKNNIRLSGEPEFNLCKKNTIISPEYCNVLSAETVTTPARLSLNEEHLIDVYNKKEKRLYVSFLLNSSLPIKEITNDAGEVTEILPAVPSSTTIRPIVVLRIYDENMQLIDSISKTAQNLDLEGDTHAGVLDTLAIGHRKISTSFKVDYGANIKVGVDVYLSPGDDAFINGRTRSYALDQLAVYESINTGIFANNCYQ